MVLHAGLELEPGARVDGPGPHGADRLPDVLGGEPARQHQATLDRGRSCQVQRILLLPRQVDHETDLPAAAQEHRVPTAVLAAAAVELVEVGVRLVPVVDPDGDGEHPLRDRQHLGRSARALAGQDEARQVGTGLGCRGDVLLARQPADLHERPREQLPQLGRRVRRLHQGRADEDRVGAGDLGGRPLCPRPHAALRDDDRRVGEGAAPSDQVELRGSVDGKRGEVARVDADHRRAQRGGALQLMAVVGLDERLQPQLAGAAQQPCRRGVVEVAQQEQHGVGARLARRAQVLLRREEALREQRQPRGRARRAQVVPRAAEAVVDEHRDGRGARPLVRGCEPRGVGVRPDVAERRRPPLDLGDGAEPRAGERIPKAHA